MNGRVRQSRAMRLLVVAALLLRVAIPAGYMPASVATDGWYLQWCPNGVPADVMVALFERASPAAANPHAHHHHHGELQDVAESSRDTAGPTQCDFGLLGADAHGAPPSLIRDLKPTPADRPLPHHDGTVDDPLRVAYRSRAPPHPPAPIFPKQFAA